MARREPPLEATSAYVHVRNYQRYEEAGIKAVDLTPAARGPYVVPPANLTEHIDKMNVTGDQQKDLDSACKAMNVACTPASEGGICQRAFIRYREACAQRAGDFCVHERLHQRGVLI